jgi:enterochelin esterase family protein
MLVSMRSSSGAWSGSIIFLLSMSSTLGALGGCGSPPRDPRSGAAGDTGASGVGGPSGTAGTGAAGANGAAGDSAGSAGGLAGATGGSSLTDGGGGQVAGASGATGAAGAVDAGLSSDAGPRPPGPGEGNFTLDAPYANAPELKPPAGVPRGVTTHFTIASSESPIFPGVTGGYTRECWGYVPAQYVKGTPAPFIIVQDGRDYMTMLPAVLDTMIAAKRLPVIVGIMCMAGPGDGPGSERGFEYDTVSDAFVRWVESTVLPKVTKLLGVTFTTDPDGRCALGGSSGGSAAFSMGWFRPDLYHRILSYSGSFAPLGITTDYPHGAYAYPEHLVADAAAKPLRVYLEVADMDAGAKNTEASMKNWIFDNQQLAAALAAKGYHYHFDLARGAVHNDPKVVGQTLPAALEWLWSGYPIN